MAVKLIMVVLFFSIMVGVGLYCKKKATDVSSFVLGGRSVGPWMTAFSYGTSYFSAVIFVGYAGQFGWKFGIASTWIGLGNAFIGSLLAWIILGRRTRLMTQHLNSATMPDFFSKRYNSNGLKILASVVTFAFLIPYTASLYNGLSRLFAMAFNVDYAMCVIIMAVLTGVYVVAGGYMATAINDFIQGIIMLVGIMAVIMAVLNLNGGFLGSLAALGNVSDPTVSDVPGIFASFFGPEPLELLGVVILTSLGTWGLPQMVQKFYAIKSEKSISKGTVISTIFAVIVAGGCYFLGGFGRIVDVSNITNEAGAVVYDAIIPEMIAMLPDFLIAVVIILVLSASMSTLASLVLTSSSTITIDLIKDNISKDMSEKKQLTIIRCFVMVFILISAYIAIMQYRSANNFIAQLMGVSWGALAGAFLAPFLYGMYYKKTTKTSIYVCIVFGAGIMVLNLLFRSAFPVILQSPINCGAFAMLAGLIIVPLVSLVTPKPNSKDVDAMFSCYDRDVVVKSKKSLSE